MGTVLKSFTKKNWFAMIGLFLSSLLLVALTMLIVDNITLITVSIQMKDEEGIWKSGLLLVIFSLLLFIAYGLLELLSNWNASDIVTRLRESIYEKINRFSVADLNAFSTESLITRTTNDMQNLHLALLTAFRVVFVVPMIVIWSLTKIMNSDLTLTLSSGAWIVFRLAPKFGVLF
ncbi:MAG: hypothetical protein MJ072_01555, partial [Clostridia bacterium]|nr:hypothetical protein [Clostridia bacterium]